MNVGRSVSGRAFLALSVSGILGAVSPAWAEWPQWGGPDRNFVVATSGLADKWPESGPKRLWRRTLGTGFSSIAVDDGRLFTQYRKRKRNNYEYTVALDAATGKTIWEKSNKAAVPEETEDYGKDFSGPNATPLVAGSRLYTIGRNATLHCYRKTDGEVLWKHDLLAEFGAQIQTCGFSSSPIAYGNTIIVPVGQSEKDKREGSSLIAFDQANGDVVWRSQTFEIEHSSPILITLGGEAQLVQCTKTAVIGVNPGNGVLLWKYAYPEPERFVGVFVTPVWNGKDVIVFSSRELGCAIKLVKGESGTTPELLWSSNKTPMGMGTPVLLGDMLVGTRCRASGNEQAPYMAVDVYTGKRLWVKRILSETVGIGAGDKLILLAADGTLALVTATPEGPTVHSQYQVLEQYSFTAPALVGTTLYLRDEKHIMALDLGAAANGE